MRRQLAADTGKWLGGRIALGLDTALTRLAGTR